LKLSTEWRFLNLRELSKSELESRQELKLTSTEKIILGRKASISSWVIEGYEELISRDEAIDDEEAIEMELLTAIRLFRLRELRIKGQLRSGVHILEEQFEYELNDIRDIETTLRPFTLEQESIEWI
jgi:hypothetical protein